MRSNAPQSSHELVPSKTPACPAGRKRQVSLVGTDRLSQTTTTKVECTLCHRPGVWKEEREQATENKVFTSEVLSNVGSPITNVIHNHDQCRPVWHKIGQIKEITGEVTPMPRFH